MKPKAPKAKGATKEPRSKRVAARLLSVDNATPRRAAKMLEAVAKPRKGWV
jgi:hypothetical protein